MLEKVEVDENETSTSYLLRIEWMLGLISGKNGIFTRLIPGDFLGLCIRGWRRLSLTWFIMLSNRLFKNPLLRQVFFTKEHLSVEQTYDMPNMLVKLEIRSQNLCPDGWCWKPSYVNICVGSFPVNRWGFVRVYEHIQEGQGSILRVLNGVLKVVWTREIQASAFLSISTRSKNDIYENEHAG